MEAVVLNETCTYSVYVVVFAVIWATLVSPLVEFGSWLGPGSWFLVPGCQVQVGRFNGFQ